jgi:hypothetical protein
MSPIERSHSPGTQTAKRATVFYRDRRRNHDRRDHGPSDPSRTQLYGQTLVVVGGRS